jgi:hypothetical protein
MIIKVLQNGQVRIPALENASKEYYHRLYENNFYQFINIKNSHSPLRMGSFLFQ